MNASPAEPKHRRPCVRLAAGVILLRGDSPDPEVLLLLSARHDTWGFPKGHLEPGETDEQGARRELLEETGIENIEFLEGFRHVMEYSLPDAGGAILKRVTLFAARADHRAVALSAEHRRMQWTPISRAPALLRYEQSLQALSALSQRLHGPCE